MTGRYAYLGPEGTFTEAALAAFDSAALAARELASRAPGARLGRFRTGRR